MEILVGVREPHERYLFDKYVYIKNIGVKSSFSFKDMLKCNTFYFRLSESLRGPQKLQALTLLGHVVRRHPTWLYKISHHSLLKDLIRLLKVCYQR